jgi:hypothetical protein
MRFQLVVCLFLVAMVSVVMVCAQSQSAPAPAAQSPTAAPEAQGAPAQPASPPAPEAPKINPSDPVITIKGFCSDSSLQGDACKTVVTKEQFDKMIDDLQPGMAPPMRRRFAMQYASALSMSAEADKRHLDQSPHFQATMKFARMQVLSQELTKDLQKQSGEVSDQDIQEFYDKNVKNYEQATLIKIFVPHNKHITSPAAKDSKPAAKQPGSDDQEKQGEEAMKKEAAALRERLIKGEDPDKLEKAAFTAANLTGNPPPTKMEKIRRSGLPVDQQAALDLKADEVSEVISDASGNFIYKMVSKETVPLDSVKGEIKNQLSSQRYRESVQRYQGTPELNEAYFGPNRPAMPVAPRGMPAPPPSANNKDKDKD